jgi:hypothetical protein
MTMTVQIAVFLVVFFFQKKIVPQSLGLALKMEASGPYEMSISFMVLTGHLISDH